MAEPGPPDAAPPRSLPTVVTGLLLLVLALGIAVVGIGVAQLWGIETPSDFAVYRGAVAHLLATGGLYDFELPGLGGHGMPFTYPPFAALLMVPLVLLPTNAGLVVWAVVQLVLALVLVLAVVRPTRFWPRVRTLDGAALAGLGWLAVVLSAPGLQGVVFGQVSLAVVTLVVVDQLLVPPRWRGWLTGIAAALKLTPLVFLGFFLVTRQWRVLVQTALGASLATALGALVLPAASWQYWTVLLWQTDRVGGVAEAANKSLLGVLVRLLGDVPAARTVWLVVAAAVTVAALYHARRLHRCDQQVAAVLTVGLLSAVISPVTWIHHLVWLPLVGVHLAFSRTDWLRWAGVAVLVAFLNPMPLLSSESPFGWALLGDAGALVVLVLAVAGVPAAASAADASVPEAVE